MAGFELSSFDLPLDPDGADLIGLPEKVTLSGRAQGRRRALLLAPGRRRAPKRTRALF